MIGRGRGRRSSGLDRPDLDDAETLAGESACARGGSGFDLETFFTRPTAGPPDRRQDQGRPDAIQDVVARSPRCRCPPEAFDTDADGDMVAIGPNPDYRSQILEDGRLGDSDVFQDVVREAERGQRDLLRQLRRRGDWLADLAEGDRRSAENLEPLAGPRGQRLARRTSAPTPCFRLTTD